jgi:hypothetical protein
MKIHLQIKPYVNLRASEDGYRSLRNSESKEINRILTYLQKEGTDPNVQDVKLKNDLTQREILMFLSSGCPELINFLGILLAYSNFGITLNSNDRYSIILFVIQRCPQALPTVLREFGLSVQEDLSDILRNVRIRVIYKTRPKRTQRHRGYRDKGSLLSEQASFRRQLSFDEAAEEAEYLIQRDRELKNTLDFILGWIS